MKFKAFTFILLWAVLALNLVVAARPTDHPAQTGNMLEKSARANAAYTYGIPRPDFYYTVAERRERIIAASWASPREGRIVTEKATGRWHHSQHVRRMF